MRGFTLIEVLVALIIVATALGVGTRAAAGIADREAARDSRMLARWVAADRIAEIRARRLFPAVGVSEGQVEQAGQPFYWRETVVATPLPRFRHWQVEVAASPGGPSLASLGTVLYGDRL